MAAVIITAAILTVVILLGLAILGMITIAEAANQAHGREEWKRPDDRKGKHEEL